MLDMRELWLRIGRCAIDSDDLMSYLFEDSQHEPSRRLRGMLQNCARFSEFVGLNRRKIHRKIRCACREELGDVLAKVRVACLLLSIRVLFGGHLTYLGCELSVLYRTVLWYVGRNRDHA